MPYPDWKLIDQYDPIEDMDEYRAVELTSAVDLRQRLLTAQMGPPRVLILSQDPFPQLFVGIGGSFGGILCFDNEKTTFYATTENPVATEAIGFISEGLPHFFQPIGLLPAQQVIELVIEYVETNVRPAKVRWQNWRDLENGQTSSSG